MAKEQAAREEHPQSKASNESSAHSKGARSERDNPRGQKRCQKTDPLSEMCDGQILAGPIRGPEDGPKSGASKHGENFGQEVI